jgi:proline dehydrogenase
MPASVYVPLVLDPNLLYRSLVLNIAHRRTIEHLVTTRGWSFARRFVAGTEAADALLAVDDLEKVGVHGILDLLGEMVSSPHEVDHFAAQIRDLVRAFGQLPYPRYVSIKLTQVGLDIDPDRMLDVTRQILDQARAADCFVRIDMEDSPRVDATIQAFRALRSAGYENVGLVLQAYLRRTADDLASLLALSPNLRVVKGAYKESDSVAFQDRHTIDRQFIELAQTNLKAGNVTAIATHDTSIIDSVQEWVRSEGVDPKLVEYQFLYGIRRDLQVKLAAEGHRVRAYVPFGTHWYPYFSRRIAERPENAVFILRAILGG